MIYVADWVVPVESPPIADGAVAARGARIEAIGRRSELVAAFPGEPVEALAGCVIAPGFVNLHTHIEYAGYGGLGDGLAFGDWLHDHIARKRRLEPGDVAAMVRLGALACLRSVVTTIVDASFAGEAVGAASAAGLRAVVALEAFGVRGADPQEVADELDARLSHRASEAGPLVELAVSPHSPYTVERPVFAEIVARARVAGRRVVTHVAESRQELEALRGGGGPLAGLVAPAGAHPVSTLTAAGLLGPETIVVHAVQVGPAEIDLLAASGCAVAHCPRSNALLGCGVAPIGALRTAGVPLGLGTDSPASALDLDMFEEMRAAILLARASAEDPSALSAEDVLRLATRGGAAALGRDDLGYLGPGARADLVAVRLADGPLWPCEDPVRALVLGGSPGRAMLTLVEGEVRFRAGEGAYEAALEAAAASRRRLADSS